MPVHLWIITLLCVWAGSLVFAAFGLHGVSPADRERHADPFVRPDAVCFRRWSVYPAEPDEPDLADDCEVQPAIRSEHPRARSADRKRLDAWSLVYVLVWLAIFASGAVWRLRKDTARVRGAGSPRGSEEPGHREHPVRVVQDAGWTGDARVPPDFKATEPASPSRCPSFRRRHEGHRPPGTRTICTGNIGGECSEPKLCKLCPGSRRKFTTFIVVHLGRCIS